ncbi:MAG TPA: sensor histidine kinase, partial [Sphingobacteriaceae bacterium]
MRRLPFLLLIFVCTGASALPVTDSLQQALKRHTGDKKVKTWNSLITNLQPQAPDSALASILQLKAYSVKNGSDKGLMFAYYQFGIYYNMRGDYERLKTFADSCLELYTAKKLQAAGGYGHQLTGVYFWQIGRYDKALQSQFKGLKIREAMKDSAGIGASLASIGVVHLSSNQPAKAETSIRKALDISYRLKDDNLSLRCLHTLANLYGMQGQYERALETDRIALRICERTGNRRAFSEFYSNMALCFFYQGKPELSLSYHNKVLEIDRFFKDDKQIADTYLNMALVYRSKKDHTATVLLLQHAVDLFEKTRHKQGLREAYRSLSEAHKENGDHRKAYSAYLDYHKVAEEISNEKNNRNLAQLNVEYETEQRQQKIRSLSQEATIRELQLKQRNIFLAIAVGLLLAGSTLAILFYKHRRLREAAKLQEEISRQQQLAARAVLDAEEQERRRIATELHDGVGQTMSGALVNLNLLFDKLPLASHEKALADRSISLVSEGYDELRNLSHRVIPTALMRKGLVAAVKDLVDRIDASLLKISFEASGLSGSLDPHVETALYRIVQESVNNVIKHAEASRLFIQLARDEEGISLTIEDNGKGFDAI